ncbi:MAG TPA: hypothetical protein VMG34_11170 [Bacteroidota bacterium]|nr:hypothetical protein [Bacteroidota bacterium]
MKKILVITLFAIACTSLATAQDPFQRPSPGPERAKLSFLPGEYTTESRLMPGPMSGEGSVGTGTESISYGVDSMFLFLDDQSVNPAFGKYRARGVLGYDPRNSSYFLNMYNNFGDAPSYKGTMNGDTLVLTTKVEFQGGSFDQKLVWYKDGKSLRLKIYNDMGEGSTLVIDQTSTPIPAEGKK